MYFTETPELRKFEREMQQKPNFNRRNDDCDENDDAHFSDSKNLDTQKNRKDGGWFYDNKNQKSYLNVMTLKN